MTVERMDPVATAPGSDIEWQRSYNRLKTVDLRGEDEVAFRQAVDLMSPDR